MDTIAMAPRRILVIAGSDSSGGAGLEADQKVIAAHGCYAMTATTALTAQNTKSVSDIHHVPAAFIKKQIHACIEDIGVDVVKTGMLASAETVRTISQTLRELHVPMLVVDPVMVASSGAVLLPKDAIKSLREELMPYTSIFTPNLPEAKLLLEDAGLGEEVAEDLNGLKRIATLVQSLGPSYVLLKGGHVLLNKDGSISEEGRGTDHAVFDILCGDGRTIVYQSKFIESNNTHGTGCSLASAIACNLASRMDIQKAVAAAISYVGAGIETSVKLGGGHGPINHFHSTYILPFAPGRFIQYLLDREDVREAWQKHTEHRFVSKLADGSLPLDAFKFYLIQDYLYLIQFMRANALAAYKAKTVEDIGMSASIVIHIQNEMNLHLDYCKEFGLSKADVESHEESQACTAYTRYMLEIGQSEDWLALQISFAPCLLGYGMIARRLYDDPRTVREGNLYWKWIENYVADDYTEAVKTGSDLLERHALKQSPSRIEELVRIFIHATNMEAGFWDMGMGQN